MLSKVDGHLSDIADGVVWATDNGVDIINISLGSSSKSFTLTNACEHAFNTA